MYTLNKERIIDIQNEARKAAKKIVPDRELPCFDCKVLSDLNNRDFEQLKESIQVYELKWRENAELIVICDMALAYLDTTKATKE